MFWVTISLAASTEADAETEANHMATAHNGRVIDVQREPPQGATIVGDMHEDKL